VTIDFQTEILRFLCQNPRNSKYIKIIDKSLFELREHQVAFDVLQKYVETFKGVPKKTNILEFFDKETKGQDVSAKVRKLMMDTFKDLYDVTYDIETNQVENSLIEFAQFRSTKLLFQKYSPELRNGGMDTYRKVSTEMNRIVRLAETLNVTDEEKGRFLLRDFSFKFADETKYIPTFLKGINRTRASGGFKPPELVVLMGAPKSFKTGFAINLATNFVKQNYKVYYADCENGLEDIEERFHQCLLECSLTDYLSGNLDNVLEILIGNHKRLGGELYMNFYPAETKTMDDVDADLQRLWDEFKWKPDIIIFDYLDLMLSCLPTTDKRIRIQRVYHDSIRLLNKWRMVGFTMSQVRREAVSKVLITMQDFSEDFGKAANAHAAFAICRTEEELEQGFARIVPVVQRRGQRFNGKNITLVSIDENTQQVKEVDLKEFKNLKIIQDE